MKHYTIDSDNNITVHLSRKSAAETNRAAFATQEQFADLIGPDSKRLVEIWNSLPGVKPVTKFTSRKTATERIWRAIQNVGGTSPSPAAHGEPSNAETGTPQTCDVSPRAKSKAKAQDKATTAPASSSALRARSKTAQVIEMLGREGRVTLSELMTAMGWQSHTTRALMSAGGSLAKKYGLAVLSTKGEDGERTYSLNASAK